MSSTHNKDQHAAAHPEPNYMMIFMWLFILTAAEVGIVLAPGIPRAAVAFCLVVMALVKAALVGTYFMHLKFERRTLAAIAITPLFLCVFLLLMLLPDAIK